MVDKLATIRPELASNTTSSAGKPASDKQSFIGVIQSHWIVSEPTSQSPFGDSRTLLPVNNSDAELSRDIDVNPISVWLQLEGFGMGTKAD